MSEIALYDPYKAHMMSGYVRDFSMYREYLGDAFAKAAARAFKAMVADLRPTSDRTYFYRTLRFLDFLAYDESTRPLRELLLDGVTVNKSSLYQIYASAASNYHCYLQQKSVGNRTRHHDANVASRMMKCLAAKGAWVHGIKLPGFKYVKSSIGTSLLSAKVLQEVPETDVVELVEYYRQSWDAADERFFENILLSNDRDDLSVDRLLELSITMLNDRITRLRSLCAEVIVSRQKCLDDADRWVFEGRLVEKAKQLHRLFIDTELKGKAKGLEYSRVLEADALKILVVYCKLFCNGIFPKYSTDIKIYCAFCRQLNATNISRESVESYLVADMTALTAAFAYLMIEYSGNGDSIRYLTIDCMNEVPDSNDVQILWQKHRRGHDSEETVFSERRSANKSLTVDTITPHCVISYVLAATPEFR